MVKPIGDNNVNDSIVKTVLRHSESIGNNDALATYSSKILRNIANVDCSAELKSRLKDRASKFEKSADHYNSPLARLERAESRLSRAEKSLNYGYDSTKHWGTKKQSAYKNQRTNKVREYNRAVAEFEAALAAYKASRK